MTIQNFRATLYIFYRETTVALLFYKLLVHYLGSFIAKQRIS